jgi:hypothetical protein
MPGMHHQQERGGLLWSGRSLLVVYAAVREDRMLGKGSSIVALLFVLQMVFAGAGERAVADSVNQAYPAMASLDQYLISDQKTEIALARSAAPSTISDGADVMVLGRDGYTLAAKGSNGFLCIVERSWAQSTDDPEFWNPKMRAPQCFNAQAAKSFAPIYLMKTKLVLAGKSRAEIASAITTALDSKEAPPLEPGGMAYMMSKEQYLNDRGKAWRAHAMFFFPGNMDKSWAADDPNSPVMVAHDAQERVTILFVLADKWSDGSAAPSK